MSTRQDFSELYPKLHRFPLVGQMVAITRPVSETDKEAFNRSPGMIYEVIRYSEPSGYAVIKPEDGGPALWVNPESLERM